MELKQYFQIVWKWRWLIALGTVCAGIASFVVSSKMPPVYQASVMLMLNQADNTAFVDYSSLLSGQRVMETYRELLRTRPILETVSTRLNLPYPLDQLAERIEVSVIPETQLLRLRVEDNDAQRAADIANEIARTFLVERANQKQLREIEAYEQTVVQELGSLGQAIDQQTEAGIDQSGALSGTLTSSESAARAAGRVQDQVAYSQLLAGYLNLQISKTRLLDLTVVEPAHPPDQAIAPRKALNTAIAAAGGFIVVCVFAFLFEYLNDTLDSADEVRDALDLPDLGTIPFVGSRQRNGRIRAQEDEWQTLEAFRILRTNIQFANVDNTVRTLLVTSAGPGEGKTSTAVNLGIAMAQNGCKVLLVDADLRRSSLHRAFEVPNATGLTSLLLGVADRERCIVETDIPDLSVLPGGPPPPNPSELLGSQRMAQAIKEFRSLVDVVVFDVPPVLTCADSAVLASQTDGVVLVVDGRSTRREAAKRALGMLRSVEANVLGSVLNKAATRSYGYYYDYSSNGKKPTKPFWLRWRSQR